MQRMKSENKVFVIGGIVLLIFFLLIFVSNYDTGICDGKKNCPIATVCTFCLFMSFLFIGIGIMREEDSGTNEEKCEQ